MKPLVQRERMKPRKLGDRRKALRVKIRPNALSRRNAPKMGIFLMYKMITGIENISRTTGLFNMDWEFIENHVMPIFPRKRRPISMVTKTSASHMHVRNIPRNAPVSEPEG
jgi:hypothetical protein